MRVAVLPFDRFLVPSLFLFLAVSIPVLGLKGPNAHHHEVSNDFLGFTSHPYFLLTHALVNNF
jgi:hypothetical protein